MKLIQQTIEGAENGNCLAASLASILEFDIEDFPEIPNDPDWLNLTNAYLREMGYYLMLINTQEPETIKGYHLIIGRNDRLGCYHAKVGYDGKEVFDPSVFKPALSDVLYGLLIKILN